MGGASDSIPARLDRKEPADVVVLARNALDQLGLSSWVPGDLPAGLGAQLFPLGFVEADCAHDLLLLREVGTRRMELERRRGGRHLPGGDRRSAAPTIREGSCRAPPRFAHRAAAIA